MKHRSVIKDENKTFNGKTISTQNKILSNFVKLGNFFVKSEKLG